MHSQNTWQDTLCEQAEGPQCPFGLVSAPCHGAKGLSQGGNRVDAAHRCALYCPEELWHPARSNAEGKIRGQIRWTRMSPRRLWPL